MSKNAVTLTNKLVEVRLYKDTQCCVCLRDLKKGETALRLVLNQDGQASNRFCLTCKPNRTGFPRDAGVSPGHRNRLRKAAMRSKVKAELSRQTTARP